ncbi:hypothetical protein I7I53_11539 [Histoplasma capsulatum var. duboisii H88]|uniref:Uncharacterized protein n=1 Tax=Ajellomyces capsulatus (strain H88) TaxID=544711 RepID=A0A8A1LXV2_AJEC8|nr:hypothetical protein I7I53_11539 [Histoplasma capsulatum var. duboisii H88]
MQKQKCIRQLTLRMMPPPVHIAWNQSFPAVICGRAGRPRSPLWTTACSYLASVLQCSGERFFHPDVPTLTFPSHSAQCTVNTKFADSTAR